MNGFLAGFGLGVGIGMLVAPVRGQDAREIMAVRGSELADTARQQVDKVSSGAEKLANMIRSGDKEKVTTGT